MLVILDGLLEHPRLLLEVANALRDLLGGVRKLVGPQKQERDNQDHEDLAASDAKHLRTIALSELAGGLPEVRWRGARLPRRLRRSGARAKPQLEAARVCGREQAGLAVDRRTLHPGRWFTGHRDPRAVALRRSDRAQPQGERGVRAIALAAELRDR